MIQRSAPPVHPLAIVRAGLVVALLLSALVAFATTATSAQAAPTRIMPLGDSSTDG